MDSILIYERKIVLHTICFIIEEARIIAEFISPKGLFKSALEYNIKWKVGCLIEPLTNSIHVLQSVHLPVSI